MNVDDCKKAKKELENDLTQGAMFRMSGYELVAMNRQEEGEDAS